MFIKINVDGSKKYPYYLTDLKKDNRNVSFPKSISKEILNKFNVFEVIIESDPTYNPDTQQVLTSKIPELINGVWVISKIVVNLDPETIARHQERKKTLEKHKKLKEKYDAIRSIIVTTSNGNRFDGDEESQSRMSRTIMIMNTSSTKTVNWKLADNTFATITIDELTEAFTLAGRKQNEIWEQFG